MSASTSITYSGEFLGFAGAQSYALRELCLVQREISKRGSINLFEKERMCIRNTKDENDTDMVGRFKNCGTAVVER